MTNAEQILQHIPQLTCAAGNPAFYPLIMAQANPKLVRHLLLRQPFRFACSPQILSHGNPPLYSAFHCAKIPHTKTGPLSYTPLPLGPNRQGYFHTIPCSCVQCGEHASDCGSFHATSQMIFFCSSVNFSARHSLLNCSFVHRFTLKQ